MKVFDKYRGVSLSDSIGYGYGSLLEVSVFHRLWACVWCLCSDLVCKDCKYNCFRLDVIASGSDLVLFFLSTEAIRFIVFSVYLFIFPFYFVVDFVKTMADEENPNDVKEEV